MVQTAVATQQQIRAIEKYLSKDWTAEEPMLLEARRRIAEEVVPQLLAGAVLPVPPGTIEDYVTLLSDAPESEQGRRAISHLTSLQFTPAAQLLERIADYARLSHIKERFFGLKANGEPWLSYEALSFAGGRVTIEANLSWEQIRTTFPSDSTLTAFCKLPLTLVSVFGEFPAKISREMDLATVIETAANKTRQYIPFLFQTAGETGGQNGLKTGVSAQFPEGRYADNKLQLFSYTPRLEPMLYKLLELKH